MPNISTTVQTAAMGQIPRSTERFLVKKVKNAYLFLKNVKTCFIFMTRRPTSPLNAVGLAQYNHLIIYRSNEQAN